MDTLVEDRLIAGLGSDEQDWRPWLEQAQIPHTSLAALVKHKRVVIVAPHPDDEILGCGGLIAALAENGYEISLIALTDGEASHVGSSLWPPELLAVTRIAETVKALAALKADGVSIIRAGFKDGCLIWQHAALVDFLLPHISAQDTVICTWHLDGHPDHEAAGSACAEVAQATGASLLETPIWAWHWAEPGDKRLPWHKAVKFGLSADEMKCKKQAIALFKSQTEPDSSTGQAPILPDYVLKRFYRSFEIFFTRDIFT